MEWFWLGIQLFVISWFAIDFVYTAAMWLYGWRPHHWIRYMLITAWMAFELTFILLLCVNVWLYGFLFA